MVAGSKRRSAENLQPTTLSYLTNICLVAEHTRDSCLVALLFLTGRRITELLDLRKKDLVITPDFLSIKTFNLKAFRKESNKEFFIPLNERFYSQIQIDISRSTEAYQDLGPFIEGHLNTLKETDYVFGRFRGHGHIGRCMAYKIVIFLCPDIWLHWFRHQRFTQVYNVAKARMKDPFDVVMVLHDFTKHRRLDTTLGYIHRLTLQEIKKEI